MSDVVAASVVLTTCCRTEHLFWYLESLAVQDAAGIDLEVIVVNDGLQDATESIVNSFTDCLPIRYVFTGQRNACGLIRRAMGFAANVGIRQAKSDIVVLSCADLYLMSGTLRAVVRAAADDPLALGTPSAIYDDDGRMLSHLAKFGTEDLDGITTEVKSLPTGVIHADPKEPYFMAIRKDHLMAIRGYDEDFTGYACEDDDLILRLIRFGCRLCPTECEAVHLYHGDRDTHTIAKDPAYLHNLSLLNSRQALVVRNLDREWGVP